MKFCLVVWWLIFGLGLAHPLSEDLKIKQEAVRIVNGRESRPGWLSNVWTKQNCGQNCFEKSWITHGSTIGCTVHITKLKLISLQSFTRLPLHFLCFDWWVTGERAYQVSIQEVLESPSTSEHYCGGTLISEQPLVVATAAHCTRNMYANIGEAWKKHYFSNQNTESE